MAVTKRWFLLALLLPLVAWETAMPWTSVPFANYDSLITGLTNYEASVENISTMSPSTVNWTATAANNHFALVAFLDLWDWELESLTRDCSPPASLPSYCCPSGEYGNLDYRNNRVCLGTTRQHHEKVKRVAMEHLRLTNHMVKTDAAPCDLCRVIELMYAQSLSLTMSGDSVMRQSAEAFHCALARRGYETEMQTLPGIGRILSIKSPQWTHHVNVTIYNTVRGFRPHAKDLEERPADILLHNDGLHHSSQGRYTTSIRNLLQKFTAGTDGLASIRLFMFRETSAQHFDAPEGGGYWERNQSSTAGCIPLRWGPLAGWREPIVRNEASKANITVVTANETMPQGKSSQSELVVLPFYNFTSELYDFHFNSEDCSHFCASPYFWWQQWRSLRLAMEREFG